MFEWGASRLDMAQIRHHQPQQSVPRGFLLFKRCDVQSIRVQTEATRLGAT